MQDPVSFDRSSLRSSSRRKAWQLVVAACALGATSAPVLAQQDFPTRPIRLVVAYAPGGSTDHVARMFAQDLGERLGQSVVVENRAGGGTLVGTDSVRRANADGYTLLYGTNAFVITPLLHERETYSPTKDFKPVSLTAMQSLALLVSPELGINSVAELVDYAKANPGKLNFASSGNGSLQHLAGEAFAKAADIKMVHVPYKGAGPAMTDLLGGRVHMMVTSLVGNMDHIKDKRLTLIATTGARRGPATPDVPTVAESGFPGFAATSWQSILAPANTPDAVVSRLNKAVAEAANAPKIREALAAQGMEVQPSTSADLGALLQSETEKYKSLLESAGSSLQ